MVKKRKEWVFSLVSHSPSCSVGKLCPTLCDPQTASCQASLSFTISLSLFKLMSIESVIPANHLILCYPLLLLPSFVQGLFQWLGSSHQVATILELQLQSFQWIFRVDLVSDWLVWSPCCPRDTQESSPARSLLTCVQSIWVIQSLAAGLKTSLCLWDLSSPPAMWGMTMVLTLLSGSED